MQRTYSKLSKEWGGFRPVAYSLRKVWEPPLTQLSGEGDQKQEEATTVGTLLVSLKEQQIQKIESSLTTKITTAQGIVVLGGLSFNRSVVEVLLDLQKDGINYFYTQLFWYDRDHVTDDLVARNIFFAVHGNVIVREDVSFCDASDSGFDPSIFEPKEDSRPIWRNDPKWDKAWVCYWYRKFYTETRTGQLMVLRPDEPELFFYPEGRWTQHGGVAALGGLLSGIRSLLWIVIVLLGLIVFEILRK